MSPQMWKDWYPRNDDDKARAAAYKLIEYDNLPDLICARACFILAFSEVDSEKEQVARAERGLAAAKRLVESIVSAGATPMEHESEMVKFCEDVLRERKKVLAYVELSDEEKENIRLGWVAEAEAQEKAKKGLEPVG